MKKFIIIFFSILLYNKTFAKNVIISGEVKDFPLKAIQITTVENILTNEKVVLATDTSIGKAGSFLFKFNIDKPIIAFIANFQVFITPGDSIKLYIRGSGFKTDSIYAEGATKSHYTFYFNRPRTSQRFYSNTKDGKDFLAFKTHTFESFKKDSLYLAYYIKNNNVSSEFKEYLKNDLEYSKILFLLSVNDQVGNSKPKLSEIDKSYFNFLNKDLFSYHFKIPVYIAAAYKYNLYLTDLSSNELIDRYSHKYMDFLCQNAIKLFKQPTSEILVCNILKHYSSFKNDQIHEVFNKISKLSLSIFKNEKAINEIKRITYRYNYIKRPFPLDVKNEILKDLEGNNITFGDILKKHSNKIIYLDFWASWCIPCLNEMPNSKQLSLRYKNKDVDFVYISFDQNIKSWGNAISKIDIKSYHYVLQKGLVSNLAQYLGVGSIPRYLIIDRNGDLLNANAPRPGATNTFKLLDEHTSIK